MFSEGFKYNPPRKAIVEQPRDLLGRFGRVVKTATVERLGRGIKTATVGVTGMFDLILLPQVTDLDAKRPTNPMGTTFKNKTQEEYIVDAVNRPSPPGTIIEVSHNEELFTTISQNGGIIRTDQLSDEVRRAMELAGGLIDASGEVMIIEPLANDHQQIDRGLNNSPEVTVFERAKKHV